MSDQTIFPVLRYRDARAAIEWLENAFGFEAIAVHEADDGTVAHAELRFGGSLLMLGTALPLEEESGYGAVAPRPGASANYVAVEDADAHCARAVAAGAEVVMELTDQDYGSRDYSARDLEGNVWSFGTYRPSAG